MLRCFTGGKGVVFEFFFMQSSDLTTSSYAPPRATPRDQEHLTGNFNTAESLIFEG